MDTDSFRTLVDRLEAEGRRSAGGYRLKVAALALLGFAILALVVATAGLGLVLLAGFAIALVYTGGGALLLLLKLGKLLLVLAIPLWYLVRYSVRALFVRLPAPQGLEITRAQAPALFAAIEGMRRRMKGPRFHHVLIVDEVNAAVVQRPAFGLFGWPRNYLLLGLPLLESMPPEEALAVVAHEYGHLAGSHGRFAAFIYRLRHTWATIQAHADQWQGWFGWPLRKLVGWYAPYFNAYTFVLARSNEYQADAASAELVGAEHAAHALKRVNLVAPRFDAFMGRTLDRIADEPAPPRDLAHRWAAASAAAPAAGQAQGWLEAALDRDSAAFDTHPVLRARLVALPGQAQRLQQLPPELSGMSAASAWLAPLLESLRSRFAAEWAERVGDAWGQRHRETQQQRARLAELDAKGGALNADDALERLSLRRRLHPQDDLREQFAAYNAAHPDRALGLYLEAVARLDHDDDSGLPLLESAIALDPEATQAACERAHAFALVRKDKAAAQAWADRWQRRASFEAQRKHQADHLDFKHTLAPAGLDADALAQIQTLLSGADLSDVKAVYLVRRVLPSDPAMATYVLGLELTLWGRLRRRQIAVRNRLAALEWPLPALVLAFHRGHGRYARLMARVPGARIR